MDGLPLGTARVHIQQVFDLGRQDFFLRSHHLLRVSFQCAFIFPEMDHNPGRAQAGFPALGIVIGRIDKSSAPQHERSIHWNSRAVPLINFTF